MWCEDVLVPTFVSPLKGSIAESVLKPINLARHKCKAAISDSGGVGSSDTVSQLVKSKQANYMQLDKHFDLEASMVEELVGPRSVGRLKAMVLVVMPSADRDHSASQVHASLTLLQSSDSFKLSTRAAQEKTKVAMTLVQAIMESFVPNLKEASDCDFLKDVVVAMQWFCRAPPDAGRVIRGAAAFPIV
jgi:hypothetical protein